MNDLPKLEQFRIETRPDGVLHLIFDSPGRSMNVFSEAAIEDLGRFAQWLAESDAAGVVVRSGKSAFCAGADLTELGIAYDMIMAAPKSARPQVAFDHFFRLSQALRRLETAGKPVAAAIGGLALGGGCELALACHHRVMVNEPQAFLGLPESLVGLLPGAGGTQRLPRLVGLEAALPVLLEGKRLLAAEALARGLVHSVVGPGEEEEAAERWVRSVPEARQPWDRAERSAIAPAAITQVISARRARILEETQGHYPAPLAILDCVERGLTQPIEAALRTEMEIFAELIRRPEPRNMIQTLFLGKQEHARLARAEALPKWLPAVRAEVAGALAGVVSQAQAAGSSLEIIAGGLREAGFTRPVAAWEGAPPPPPRPIPHLRGLESASLWFEGPVKDPRQQLGQALLRASAEAAAPWLSDIPPAELRIIDYSLVSELGFPAYLGGPLALAAYLGDRMLERA